MSAKLYVGNLPFSTTDQELQEVFATHGAVISATVIMDRFSGRSRGFGFVEMSSPDEAQQAISALHESELDGRPLIVNIAKPRETRPPFRPESRGEEASGSTHAEG
ncbi:MAG: RNA-binding protein [Nitrospirales bacterium]|nr:RNA-binding protein [Nitrospira sp.]MDR4503101.1 RNA-binding protein [Nitrospirales bacterium]